MRLIRLLAATFALAGGVAAHAAPAISDAAAGALRKAITEANHGDTLRASALLQCILMPNHVTVGLQRSGRGLDSVSDAVATWHKRLANSPFVCVEEGSADLKVQFVSFIHDGRDLQGGRDVQGEVHCERQASWGVSGTRYRVVGSIIVRDNVDGRPLTSREVTAVIEHELGHVAGLDDEDEAKVLMGPFVPGFPVAGPSDQEIEALETFRAAIHSVLNQIGEHRHWVSRSARGSSRRLRVRSSLRRWPRRTVHNVRHVRPAHSPDDAHHRYVHRRDHSRHSLPELG